MSWHSLLSGNLWEGNVSSKRGENSETYKQALLIKIVHQEGLVEDHSGFGFIKNKFQTK